MINLLDFPSTPYLELGYILTNTTYRIHFTTMFTKPLYLPVAFLSALATAQEIPAGVSSSLGAINPTVYSSAASVLSASSASVASAEATSTGAANAHGE